MTDLLREGLAEWADEARTPHDLADRALRGRRRKPGRWLAVGAAVATAAALAAVFVPEREPATPDPAASVTVEVTYPPRPAAETDVRTDTENNPPKKLIAAGQYAVSAYFTYQAGESNGDPVKRRWSLYDPRSGGYEDTGWAWVDVAPGLHLAAVLEGDGLGRRVGIMDLTTREVLRWIDLEQPAGSLVWSPDGSRLLATTYSEYPDMVQKDGEQHPDVHKPVRTGYYLIDPATGNAEHHALPSMEDSKFGDPEGKPFNMNRRQDLGWSHDGVLLWMPTATQPAKVYLTLDGAPAEAPDKATADSYRSEPRWSPDGTKLLTGDGLPTKVVGRDGAVLGEQRLLQQWAWADDENVIGLGCYRKCSNEFHSSLVMTSVDGKKVTELSTYQKGDEGRWYPVLTRR
ncbi:hypothetical protein ACIBG7_33405 [Nonomuraea sp. NPDC050328]|uniref:hypothetical protein n=1 Tax=Nonomuraea sp. NPDC050328 TaxID=3364361 RepID=UPI0037A68212